MDLNELYDKHTHQIEHWHKLRNEEWLSLKARHEQMIASFGSRDNIPDSLEAQLKQEEFQYRKDWAEGTGTHYKNLKNEQRREREEITGKPEEEATELPMDEQETTIEENEPVKEAEPEMTEREKLKQQFKDEMKAIEERNKLQRGQRMR